MLNVPFDSNLIEIFVQHSAMINKKPALKTDLLHYFINTRLDSLLTRNKLFIFILTFFSPEEIENCRPQGIYPGNTPTTYRSVSGAKLTHNAASFT